MNEDDVARVSTPAILLLVTGVLLLLLDLFGALFAVFSLLSPVVQMFVTGFDIAQGADNGAIAAGVFQIVLGVVFAVIRVGSTILGLAASGVTILAGQRLLQFRSRNVILAGAILATAQPLTWVLTGCFTSGCGGCAPIVYLPMAVIGLVATIMAITTLGSLAPFDEDSPA
jgi:hypothetical protein